MGQFSPKSNSPFKGRTWKPIAYTPPKEIKYPPGWNPLGYLGKSNLNIVKVETPGGPSAEKEFGPNPNRARSPKKTESQSTGQGSGLSSPLGFSNPNTNNAAPLADKGRKVANKNKEKGFNKDGGHESLRNYDFTQEEINGMDQRGLEEVFKKYEGETFKVLKKLNTGQWMIDICELVRDSKNANELNLRVLRTYEYSGQKGATNIFGI